VDWLLVTCAAVAVAKLPSARARIGLWRSRSTVESDAAIPRGPHPSCPARRIQPAHHGDCWHCRVWEGFVAGRARRAGAWDRKTPAQGPYAAPGAAVLLT